MYNVGSIFRTADALGIDKIYLCGITPSPLNELGKPRKQLVKVSLDAEKYVPWDKVKSVPRLISELKKDGYKIFSIEQSKRSMLYSRLKLKPAQLRRVVLVVGNEIFGLPAPILKKSDKILEIPMRGKKESLNVGVAFGIVAFSLVYGND